MHAMCNAGNSYLELREINVRKKLEQVAQIAWGISTIGDV